MRHADAHIIDLGEDEDGDIFFRSTSSMPRSRSSLGDSHGLPVPNAEQGNSISGLEAAREHNAQDVFLSLRYPTETPLMVEDLFGPQTGGDHCHPARNDLLATTSSLGAVLGHVRTDSYLHSSSASASSGATIEDTFNFTKKAAGQPALSDGGTANHTLRFGAQARHTPPQDLLHLSVPYGVRPPSSTISRVSASEESPLETQGEAQHGTPGRGSRTPSAISSGSDMSISELSRPRIGDKMFIAPALLESDTASEPTICPGVGTLIDPIIVGVDDEDSKGPRIEVPHTSVDQREPPEPSASSLSAPTTSQPSPLMGVLGTSHSTDVKVPELPLFDEQSRDLMAIIMSGSKRRQAAIPTSPFSQTHDEAEDTPNQSRGQEEMDMSFKRSSEHFDKEATSFSTEVVDSTVDNSM